MKPTARLRRLLAIAGSSLFAVSSSHAADGSWNVDADGLWSGAGNWNPGIADGSGFTANFTNDITVDRTVSLDSARTLTGLVFGDSDTATAGSWILNNNGTPANVLTLAGTTPGITVNALGTGKTATISAIIGGTAGLVKSGTGTLVLSGANTYTGTTTISAGTLRLEGAAPLNTGRTYTINGGAVMNLNGGATFNTSVAGSSTINGTGTLRLSGGSYTRGAAGGGTLTLALGAGGLIDIQSTASVYTWYSPVVSFTGNLATLNVDGTIGGNNALTIQADALTGAGTISNSSTTLNIGVNNGSGMFSGSIQSTSSLTKTGTGTQTLSGANTYTGATTVNGGTLRLDMTGSGVLSATSTLALGGGEFQVKGKTSGATTQTLANFTMNSGNNRISLDPNGGTSTILTLGNAWTRNAGSSMLIDYSSANSGTREVRTAAATTTYTLSNGIYGGILVKDSAGAVGFATRAAGANVAITRYDDTTGTTLTDNSNTAATNFTTLNTTYTSGTLSWSNGITTRSVNSLTIDTTNNGGTIDMGASTNVLTLTSQGILFKGSNNSILQGGTVGASGSEIIVHQTSGTNTLTISSLISGGAGSLTKDGIGTLIVSGANTYTGTTTINAGELRLSGGAFTTTARTYQINSGAVMSFGSSGTIPTNANVTIQGTGTLRVLNGAAISSSATSKDITMNLGAGAVIDVQAGGSFGLGYQPIVWTNNLASLNMDGTHNMWDDNAIIADALTGSGTIGSSFAGGSTSLTVGTANGSGTFSGTIVHGMSGGTRTIALIKNGTGAQTLSGANTYTGATSVNAGLLNVTGTLASAVTVASGATLAGTGTTTGTLTLNAGSTIVGATAGSSFKANTVTATSAVNIVGSTGSGTIGSHTIGVVRYNTGTGPTTGNFSTAGYHAGAVVSNVGGAGGETQLTYTNAARTWNSASGAWDAMATNAWQQGDFKFGHGDAVTFDDSGTGGGSARAVTLNSLITPGSVTFNNSTSTPYTVSGTGAIAGPTGLTKSGTGVVTISNANTYTGATLVSAGTLLVSGSLVSDVTVSDAAIIGGGGTVDNLTLGGASLFDMFAAVAGSDSLTATAITFAATGFGVDNLVYNGAAVNWGTIANGTYTLIAGTLDETNLGNFGSANAFDIGGGRGAYFQEGSLQLVVATIPEPRAALLGGLGLLALLRRRRN